MNDHQPEARTEGIAKKILTSLVERDTVKLRFMGDYIKAIDRGLDLIPNISRWCMAAANIVPWSNTAYHQVDLTGLLAERGRVSGDNTV